MKKICILVGHPNKDSLSGHLADVYEASAKKAGHEVRRMNIGDMKFDPILHMGYKQRQELEPDLVAMQENVKWSETLVIIFPTWWGDMPALLKGMFDRAWLPGFAYNMKPGSLMWMRRLVGKRARLIVTSQTNPLILNWVFRATFTHLRFLTLWFSGVSPVRMTRFGTMEKISPERMAKIDKKVAGFAQKAK
jgi:NAD(P)H dehydrogenase (quinone)